jgi:DNA repair exonuclease SbcCD nuclease subunit
MKPRKEDDVALTIVHTADWHLGKTFPGFSQVDQETLSRARLSVIDRILAVAENRLADAILCAGDLFDDATPAEIWWRPLAEKLANRKWTPRPIILLPGNHDPLVPSSIWDRAHPFRQLLPKHVHVVDRDNFELDLKGIAVVYARPCRSSAGQEDPALALPARSTGDERIRIGLVHGSTFDVRQVQTYFPISREAAVQRGLDYLAVGDTHGYQIVDPSAKSPTVYPGAPEPTSFGEKDPGYVAVVFFNRRRMAQPTKERVAYWQWESVMVRSLEELRRLIERDLSRTVLRLSLDLELEAKLFDEAKSLLQTLCGTEALPPKAGVLMVDQSGLKLNTKGIEEYFYRLPEALQETARRLKEKQSEDEETADVAARALYHLYQLAKKVA